MKPAVFEYLAPSSVPEAIAALEDLGEDAKLLAGGQSLIPTMNFRLAQPSALVDIGRLPGLDLIRLDGDTLEVGALVRHRRLEVGGEVPGPLGVLLSAAGRMVGHLPIRTRGTFGGSIAHADPASEWCVLACLLDAEMVVVSSTGSRLIPASSYFVSIFTTELGPTELLTAVHLPLLSDHHRVGFCEFSRRAGDFAIVMAMVSLEVIDDVITEARVALGGVTDRPVRSSAAEAVLLGGRPDPPLFAAAGDAAANAVNPREDAHGPPEFRRQLVQALVRRALTQSTPLPNHNEGMRR